MKQELQLENFAGPLDLLLQLIENRELDITQVALAEVTEQFLEYLEQVEERSPEELADFLVVATKLLLLKSQALIPYLQVEEEEDPNELASQLKMYKRYVDAMEGVERLLGQNRFLFARKPLPQVQQMEFRAPTDFAGEQMRLMYVEVLSGLEPVVKIPKAAMEKVVTLREKFGQIRTVLHKKSKVVFQELLADAEDRGEVVVTFLALLEMIKKQEVAVQQDAPKDQIVVERLELKESSEADAAADLEY